MRRIILVLLLMMVFPTASLMAQGEQPEANPFEISKEDFFVEGSAPVRKSGPYDVTMVYFMDYQCPSCRQYTPDVARVLKEDRRIRVIYRDTPLLGPRSDAAAKAAIASHFQGRHEAFHHALMTTKGPIDEHALRAAADKARVDWTRLQRDLVSRANEIDEVIVRNHELAMATGIQGTPAFIVGQRQSNGALNYNLLKAEIADARKEAGVKAPAGEPQPDPQKRPGQTEAKAVNVDGSVEHSGSDNAPIFAPAKPISEEALQSAEGSPEDGDGGWTWLVAILVALGASAAAWKLFTASRSAEA